MNVRKHLSCVGSGRTIASHRRGAQAQTRSQLPLGREMHRLPLWILAAWIGGVISAVAQPLPIPSRGELLYYTHCVGCHTTEVHSREKTLATDWPSLRAQVLRWQANTGLGWSDGDVVAVARYLNDLYYRFPAPDNRAAAGVTRP